DRAADAGVDLVEHVRARRTFLGEHALDGEERSAELAAARDLSQSARLFAFVRRDQELDPIDPASRDSGAIDRHAVSCLRWPDVDDDARPAHAELRELFSDRVGERVGGLATLSRERAGE